MEKTIVGKRIKKTFVRGRDERERSNEYSIYNQIGGEVMRIDRSQREKDRKKKQESVFEAQVFSFVAKSLDTVINKALDEIFKDFNKKR